MDDLGGILTELFWKYFDLLWEATRELAHKAWLTLWGALYHAAAWLESAVQSVSRQVAPWQAALAALVLAAGLAFWIFRDTIYLRRFRHNIHWLRFWGYRPMVVTFKQGAHQGESDFLGRETQVPDRFPGLRLFDAIPDRYVVVFGAGNGGPARAVRTYPRLTRAGRVAMVRDLTEHVRAAGRYVNPESEVQAFLAFLAAMDPEFCEVCARKPYPRNA